MNHFYLFATGELRPVASIEKRINEARRMGFSAVIVPKQNHSQRAKGKGSWQNANFKKNIPRGIDVIEAKNLMDAIEKGLVARIPKKKPHKKQKSKKYKPKDDFIIDDDEEDFLWE